MRSVGNICKLCLHVSICGDRLVSARWIRFEIDSWLRYGSEGELLKIMKALNKLIFNSFMNFLMLKFSVQRLMVNILQSNIKPFTKRPNYF